MDASPTKRTLSDLDAEGEEDSVDADGESDLFGDFSNAPSPSAAPPAPSPATAEAVPGKKLPTFPAMTPESYATYSSDVLLSSAIDGSVTLWDRRVSPSESGGMRGVGRLQSREKTPKWCMSVRSSSSLLSLSGFAAFVLLFSDSLDRAGLLLCDRQSRLRGKAGWDC
jgi:hypothetical protein